MEVTHRVRFTNSHKKKTTKKPRSRNHYSARRSKVVAAPKTLPTIPFHPHAKTVQQPFSNLKIKLCGSPLSAFPMSLIYRHPHTEPRTPTKQSHSHIQKTGTNTSTPASLHNNVPRHNSRIYNNNHNQHKKKQQKARPKKQSHRCQSTQNTSTEPTLSASAKPKPSKATQRTLFFHQ